MKHIHILGICGTFMGSLAVIARQCGWKVTGSDINVYPPMSTYLSDMEIDIITGFDVQQLDSQPDLVIIGNGMKRGMPIIEYILNSNIPYLSGPEWLYKYVLKYKKVIAVAGTHGKTTTSSLLTKILDDAGFNPSFLIGGITQDFNVSSRLTDSEYFVIEADEYDTAFFDKRSKFMHYNPEILVINNLEFDHADIFDDMKDIYRQFHYLVRSMPSKAKIIYPNEDVHVRYLLNMGCWSEKVGINIKSNINVLEDDFSSFSLFCGGDLVNINWTHFGLHNASNALSAYTVANIIGIDSSSVQKSCYDFKGVKRRLECLYRDKNSIIYDDFAHHPTAVLNTLKAIKAKANKTEKVVAIIEPGSNSMKKGVHRQDLCDSLDYADEVWFYQHKDMQWHVNDVVNKRKFVVFVCIEDILSSFEKNGNTSTFYHYVIMSNSGFGGLQKKLQISAKSGVNAN